MKRQVPKMATDEEAEAFLASDLSDLDFAQFKPVQFKFAGAKGAAPPKGSSLAHLAPGTPAPKSGVYQQTGPRGGRSGEPVLAVRGKPLPPAPNGRTWTLVAPVHQKSDK